MPMYTNWAGRQYFDAFLALLAGTWSLFTACSIVFIGPLLSVIFLTLFACFSIASGRKALKSKKNSCRLFGKTGIVLAAFSVALFLVAWLASTICSVDLLQLLESTLLS